VNTTKPISVSAGPDLLKQLLPPNSIWGRIKRVFSGEEKNIVLCNQFIMAAHQGDLTKIKQILKDHPLASQKTNKVFIQALEMAIKTAANKGKADVTNYLINKTKELQQSQINDSLNTRNSTIN